MDTNLIQKLEILKNKLKKLKEYDETQILVGAISHNYELGPVLKEEEISSFEKDFNIKIPEEYRVFLKKLGDGGAGPGYGLYPFNKIISNLSTVPKDYFSNEFPFTEIDQPYIVGEWGHIEVIDERVNEMEDITQGSFDICHHGCGIYEFLIISGNERGRIWVNHSGECILPIKHSFLEWYEDWLDEYISKIENIKKEVNSVKRIYEVINEEAVGIINLKLPIGSIKTIEIRLNLQFYPTRPLIHLPHEVNKLIDHPNISLYTLRWWEDKNPAPILEVLRDLEMTLHRAMTSSSSIFY